ncbi:restriction endonuclease [Pectobacterium brasiliense]|uniref:restriction endonuclease n=1 Tax=Pectobacterium brasiliense TaxID=180957 RepID=UPI0032EACD45
MARDIMMDYPVPAYWQDFERLTCELCRALWEDPGTQRHGRAGQAQGGIDISGRDNNHNGQRVVVQCKKRVWKTVASKETPASSLTIQEIDDEINEFISSGKQADRYIIAITGLRDKVLQNHVDSINDSRINAFEVSIWFWDEYCEWLNENPKIEAKYYHDIVKFRGEYSFEELFCEMLHSAFDRPAFHTEFNSENNIGNFLQALESIQQALTTGNLVNRDGHVQNQVRIPDKKSLPLEYQQLKKKIQSLRDYTTQQVGTGAITQQNEWLIISNQIIAGKMNKFRVEIIFLLNNVLDHYGVENFSLEAY